MPHRQKLQVDHAGHTGKAKAHLLQHTRSHTGRRRGKGAGWGEGPLGTLTIADEAGRIEHEPDDVHQNLLGQPRLLDQRKALTQHLDYVSNEVVACRSFQQCSAIHLHSQNTGGHVDLMPCRWSF